MGCGTQKKPPIRAKKANELHFRIWVEHPITKKKYVFAFKSELNQMLLSDLMNHVAFDKNMEDIFDANFISIYDETVDDFNYYVEKLIGIHIDNEDSPECGRVWVIYINRIKQNWSYLSKFQRIIKKEDEIAWKLEKGEKYLRGSIEIKDLKNDFDIAEKVGLTLKGKALNRAESHVNILESEGENEEAEVEEEEDDEGEIEESDDEDEDEDDEGNEYEDDEEEEEEESDDNIHG